jgi:hypothetical protein
MKILTVDDLLDDGYELIIPLSQNYLFSNQGGTKMSEILGKTASKNTRKPAVGSILDGIEYVAAQKDKKIAVIAINLYTTKYLSKYYDPETGEDLLEVVPEVAYETFNAPMTRKDSPFTEVFNKYLSAYKESGMHTNHIDRAIDEANTVKMRNVGNIFEKKLIRFWDLLNLMMLYIYLMASSIILFFIEVICGQIMKKNRQKLYVQK